MEQFDLEFLYELIIDDALVLIPVLYIVGVLLRQTPVVHDWTIVWIQLFVGLIGTILLLGVGFDAFVQGILVTGATLLARSLIANTQSMIQTHQEIKKRDNDSQ